MSPIADSAFLEKTNAKITHCFGEILNTIVSKSQAYGPQPLAHGELASNSHILLLEWLHGTPQVWAQARPNLTHGPRSFLFQCTQNRLHATGHGTWLPKQLSKRAKWQTGKAEELTQWGNLPPDGRQELGRGDHQINSPSLFFLMDVTEA